MAIYLTPEQLAEYHSAMESVRKHLPEDQHCEASTLIQQKVAKGWTSISFWEGWRKNDADGYEPIQIELSDLFGRSPTGWGKFLHEPELTPEEEQAERERYEKLAGRLSADLDNKSYEPPFVIIPMPLNANGEGPAAEAETVRTVWQIWDACNMTVAEFDTEAEATEYLAGIQ
jgi:hypothetical protein